MLYPVFQIQYLVYSIQYAVSGIPNNPVFSLRYTVCSMMYPLFQLQFTLVNMRHPLFSISGIQYFPSSVQYMASTRGFNGSVNIPESCEFRSQFDPLNIICKSFFLNTVLLAYAF